MTEKRYSLGKIGCYRTKLIVDNETKHEMGNSVVVKRLNALHEENEHLKNRLKSVLNELYCKDRVLEEHKISIGCCDKND